MNDQTYKDIDRAFKALEERNELLDKIRAEIESRIHTEYIPYTGGYECRTLQADSVLKIIDKYKAESEDKE